MIRILESPWQFCLIKGRTDSGKTEVGLELLSQFLNKKITLFDELINNKEHIMLMTENIEQTTLLKDNIYDKIYIIENISTKDPIRYIKTFHEEKVLDLVIIDYINLIYNGSQLKDVLYFLKENKIRAIFIENTAKLRKESPVLDHYCDYILNTNRNSPSGAIEISLLKVNNQNLLEPIYFYLDK